jgi:hypothetical protein
MTSGDLDALKPLHRFGRVRILNNNNLSQISSGGQILVERFPQPLTASNRFRWPLALRTSDILLAIDT